MDFETVVLVFSVYQDHLEVLLRCGLLSLPFRGVGWKLEWSPGMVNKALHSILCRTWGWFVKVLHSILFHVVRNQPLERIGIKDIASLSASWWMVPSVVRGHLLWRLAFPSGRCFLCFLQDLLNLQDLPYFYWNTETFNNIGIFISNFYPFVQS